MQQVKGLEVMALVVLGKQGLAVRVCVCVCVRCVCVCVRVCEVCVVCIVCVCEGGVEEGKRGEGEEVRERDIQQAVHCQPTYLGFIDPLFWHFELVYDKRLTRCELLFLTTVSGEDLLHCIPGKVAGGEGASIRSGSDTLTGCS